MRYFEKAWRVIKYLSKIIWNVIQVVANWNAGYRKWRQLSMLWSG